MQQEPVNIAHEPTGADATFYQGHATRIFAYIYHQLPSQQDAEDIMLEVFIAALQRDNLPGLSTEEQLAWLQRVARNKIIDHFRHTLSRTMLPLEQARDIVDSDLTPEQQTLQRETYERLYRVLARLSPLEQRVIRLRFVSGLPFADIAEIVNRPENAIRALLSRTLRHLRTMYPGAERR
jgi:RNA polymerase sigma factor (sigma-70 family)